MPKKELTLSSSVMSRISREHIKIKPKWIFTVGSFFMLIGLSSAVIATVFLINLSFFLLRQHGPMGQIRLEQLLASFPWWVPVFAIAGIISGVVMLKRYDFSYKHNFPFIVVAFIGAVILAGSAIDILGFSDIWFRRGPIKQFYQRLEPDGRITPIMRGKNSPSR